MEDIRYDEFWNLLAQIVGPERILKGEDIAVDYCHDELPNSECYQPAAVVQIETTEEVADVLKLCNEQCVPATVRGAGTGKVGGSVPVHGGIILAMNGMNQIIGYDETTSTVKVQPGVMLLELKEDAERRGFYYPPDPGEKTATVGGNAATNAGGPCAVKYGMTRNYVVGATVVLPTGEILKLGGTGYKDNSGYNLLQLMIGSEGTLGVMTELTLKLMPKPKAEMMLILPFMDGESCIAAADRIIKEGLEPSVLEYIDTDLVEFSGNSTGSPVFPIEMDGERAAVSLMLTLEGKNDDDLDAKMEFMAELSEEIGCMDILVADTPALRRDTWAAHDAFHTSVEAETKCSDELNMSVPSAKMAEFIEAVKAEGASKNLHVYAYGHIGDGGVHIYVCSNEDKEKFLPVMAEVAEFAYNKCREMGGSVSSEHGIGYAKKACLLASIGEPAVALMGRIKQAFDPNGILNPGKVVA